MIDARSGFTKMEQRIDFASRIFAAYSMLGKLLKISKQTATLMIKRKPYLIMPDSYLTPKLLTSEMTAISMCHVI